MSDKTWTPNVGGVCVSSIREVIRNRRRVEQNQECTLHLYWQSWRRFPFFFCLVFLIVLFSVTCYTRSPFTAQYPPHSCCIMSAAAAETHTIFQYWWSRAEESDYDQWSERLEGATVLWYCYNFGSFSFWCVLTTYQYLLIHLLLLGEWQNPWLMRR